MHGSNLGPLLPNMYGHMFTRYLTEVKEAMMSKQNYFWRKNKQTNILQETEENITKNSYSQNCKDNSGFIQWEQGAIKGSN